MLAQRQPTYFPSSQSLLDDLHTAHRQRKSIPIVYEALLREARDAIVEHLALTARCKSLLPVAISIDPGQLWNWPALGSDSSRLQHRLANFLLPHLMRAASQSLGTPKGLDDTSAHR